MLSRLLAAVALPVLLVGVVTWAQQSGSAGPASPMKSEAEEIARARWKTLVARCGESDFLQVAHGRAGIPGTDPYIYELREVRYGVQESPVTEEERLNGFEWRGKAILRPAGFRSAKTDGVLSQPPNWDSWMEDFGDSFDVYFDISRRGGKWEFGPGVTSFLLFRDAKPLPPPPCSVLSSN